MLKMNSNHLKKIRDREVEKQRMQRLQNVCSKNNIDISVVTEMIENGKMNILLETVKEAEKQKVEKNLLTVRRIFSVYVMCSGETFCSRRNSAYSKRR